MEPCKLCEHEALPAGLAAGRVLMHCLRCGLVYVPSTHWVGTDEERARYALHDNTPANAGYVRFLREVADVAAPLVPPGGRALDFGSGSGAVLTALLRERGIDCAAYDPLYGMGGNELEGGRRFDVVVMCEVIEHLRDLRGELRRVGRVMREHGAMVVRTRLRPEVNEMPRWWYARDPTHINFLADQTLPFVAVELADRVDVTPGPVEDVFVFRCGGR